MVASRRKITPSKQLQALISDNAGLQAGKMELERSNDDLKAANIALEQRIKYLQVAVTILLASSVSLSIGLATSMAGVAPQLALTSATGTFFAVITASIAILIYLRR